MAGEVEDGRGQEADDHREQEGGGERGPGSDGDGDGAPARQSRRSGIPASVASNGCVAAGNSIFDGAEVASTALVKGDWNGGRIEALPHTTVYTGSVRILSDYLKAISALHGLATSLGAGQNTVNQASR